METDLTKKMKHGVVFFKPRMNSKMRTIRYAYEVWTPTGIVDAIRFEDYIERYKTNCRLIDYQRYNESYQNTLRNFVGPDRLGRCKIESETFPNDNCSKCVWKTKEYVVGMAITCYECKISVSDFKSENGHNFHGNFNYYVVPKEIVRKIEALVPDDIGIIVYNEEKDTYREWRPSEFREISDKIKWRLLYDAMKKWCDKRV